MKIQNQTVRIPLFLFLCIASACNDFDAAADQPLALIYRGPGSCSSEDGDAGRSGYGCSEASADAATLAGFRYQYVGPKAIREASSETEVSALFSEARVWIQPGGKSNRAYAAMTPHLRKAIRNFVTEGGGFVGFCAGAFLGTNWFDLMPGDSTLLRYSPIQRGLTYTFLPVEWDGKKRMVYFEGGPYLSQLGSDVEVTARYANGRVAAARTTFGQGRVYLAGPHPEAPEIWSQEDGVADPDGSDLDLAAGMISWSAGGSASQR